MPNEKICPLIVIAKKTSQGSFCKKDLCEWWLGQNEGCCIKHFSSVAIEKLRQLGRK